MTTHKQCMKYLDERISERSDGYRPDTFEVLRRIRGELQDTHEAMQILCKAIGWPQWKDCPEVGGQPDDEEYCDFGMPPTEIAACAAHLIRSLSSAGYTSAPAPPHGGSSGSQSTP